MWTGIRGELSDWHWLHDGTPLQGQGCYEKAASATWLGSPVNMQDLTVETCVAYCRRQDAKYAALMAGSQCACGAAYARSAPGVDCSTPCSGRLDAACGGQTDVFVLNLQGGYSLPQFFPSFTAPAAGEAAPQCLSLVCVFGQNGATWRWAARPCSERRSYVCQTGSASECHLGSPGCHRLYYAQETWHGAQMKCALSGGHLIEITSEVMQQTTVRDMVCSTASGGLWIGGTNIRWVTAGDAAGYSDWAAGEPAAARADRCVLLAAADGYRWRAADCGERQQFICQTGLNATNQATTSSDVITTKPLVTSQQTATVLPQISSSTKTPQPSTKSSKSTQQTSTTTQQAPRPTPRPTQPPARTSDGSIFQSTARTPRSTKMTTLAIVAATSLATQNFSTSTSMDVTTSSSPMGNDTSAASRGIIRDPMDDLGIVFIAVAITLICVLIVGVIAGCIRNCCCQPKKSKGLELKSSARKHGPGAFVKDADFAYIDIESTNSKDRKEVNDKADTLKKSLERYDSVHIGKVADENVNMMNVTSETQTSSSLGAQSKTKDKHHDLQTIDEDEDIEGPVRVSDSSSQPTASSRSIDQSDDDNHSEPDSTHSEPDSRRGYTPPRRLNNQLFVAKTTNIDQSQQSPVHSSEPSKSVVYVVSDPQEDERMSSAKHTPDDTDKSTSNAAAPAGPGVTESGMSLVAYIDLGNDEQGALFEDPRLYSSYL